MLAAAAAHLGPDRGFPGRMGVSWSAKRLRAAISLTFVAHAWPERARPVGAATVVGVHAENCLDGPETAG